ncbi:AEC family transporter, partial [Bifidobacterium bifidum]|uniref:AEC family transporter n=1 Tax=Bifidobacterium bifidum TaxID=1681 RepID=UPI001418EB93
IGGSAVPKILIAFGMSLHGTKPRQRKGDRRTVFTVAVLKNIVMPIIAFLLSYFVMGFRGATLYACVVLAALPTGQNVYNYAARYNVGLTFARDGILMSTMTSPIFIAVIAALLS